MYKKWMYNRKVFEHDIGDYFGFVYLITCTNGIKYIGSKQFYRYRTTAGYSIKIESDWEDYFGSSKPLKVMVKMLGTDSFQRKILQLARSKDELRYLETYLHWKYDVLNPTNNFINANISGRYFSHFEYTGPKRL